MIKKELECSKIDIFSNHTHVQFNSKPQIRVQILPYSISIVCATSHYEV